MAKRLRKSEKLDRILSELAELRAEIQKLIERQSEGANPNAKRRSQPATARPTKKPPIKKTSRAKADAKPAPGKPMLVEVPSPEQPAMPASRSA